MMIISAYFMCVLSGLPASFPNLLLYNSTYTVWLYMNSMNYVFQFSVVCGGYAFEFRRFRQHSNNSITHIFFQGSSAKGEWGDRNTPRQITGSTLQNVWNSGILNCTYAFVLWGLLILGLCIVCLWNISTITTAVIYAIWLWVVPNLTHHPFSLTSKMNFGDRWLEQRSVVLHHI